MSTEPLTPEDDALAAEYALSLLEGAERAEFEARLAREPGLAAAVAAAVFGSGAVIATRRLKGEPAVSLMAFYTLALTALTAVPAALVWHPVAAADLPALLAIGVLAQVGQYCFVRAHHLASAGVLAPLGYLHLVLAAVAGFVLFGERPTAAAVVGAAIIVAATALAARPPGPGIR